MTQFDMKYVEGAGLVKFDFLGLKTLSVLQEGASTCSKQRGIDVDLDCAATGRSGRSMSCSSAATRSACSSWNPKACAARWRR